MRETSVAKSLLAQDLSKILKNADTHRPKAHGIVYVNQIKAELVRRGYSEQEARRRARSLARPEDSMFLLDELNPRQLADRCRSLERQLQETKEALRAAEERENCLILERIREGL